MTTGPQSEYLAQLRQPKNQIEIVCKECGWAITQPAVPCTNPKHDSEIAQTLIDKLQGEIGRLNSLVDTQRAALEEIRERAATGIKPMASVPDDFVFHQLISVKIIAQRALFGD